MTPDRLITLSAIMITGAAALAATSLWPHTPVSQVEGRRTQAAQRDADQPTMMSEPRSVPASANVAIETV